MTQSIFQLQSKELISKLRSTINKFDHSLCFAIRLAFEHSITIICETHCFPYYLLQRLFQYTTDGSTPCSHFFSSLLLALVGRWSLSSSRFRFSRFISLHLNYPKMPICDYTYPNIIKFLSNSIVLLSFCAPTVRPIVRACIRSDSSVNLVLVTLSFLYLSAHLNNGFYYTEIQIVRAFFYVFSTPNSQSPIPRELSSHARTKCHDCLLQFQIHCVSKIN